jgi:hypothetical protein
VGRSISTVGIARISASVLRIKLGSALAALVKPFGGLELEIKRDKKPARPADLA